LALCNGEIHGRVEVSCGRKEASLIDIIGREKESGRGEERQTDKDKGLKSLVI
jgi:hypothetical protein